MRLCSIASGSSGNCIFAGSDNSSVLIDAGVSGKRIEVGLGEIDRSVAEVDAILVTHEHSDHVMGLGVLARRYDIPIYATQQTIDALQKSTTLGKIPRDLYHPVEADQEFSVGDLTVHPFTIPHDAAGPVGYRIDQDGKSLGIATDLGEYNDYIVQTLQGLDALLLESNHDIRMLEVGRYPYYLKRRILGNHGHLSNESAGRLLCELLHDDIQSVQLGHLSKENNYEDLALETVCSEVTMGDNPYRSKDFEIKVAHRDKRSDLIEW